MIVRTYSLGMKQRRGIAIALLQDPELLIFDEPANGLDPAGIVEMRDLMHRLADQGKTVFISSHLLSEVQQPWGRSAYLSPDGAIIAPAPQGHGRDLNFFLGQSGFFADTLSPATRDLEQVFLQLTNSHTGDIK